jgi:hypothetical protein
VSPPDGADGAGPDDADGDSMPVAAAVGGAGAEEADEWIL